MPVPVLSVDQPADEVIDLFALNDVLALPVVNDPAGSSAPSRSTTCWTSCSPNACPAPAASACSTRGGMRRASGLAALAAVVGPGVLAGLSDDDPAGITTYSILGADYGYSLLWVLLLSTLALIVFHELGARTGIAPDRDSLGCCATASACAGPRSP